MLARRGLVLLALASALADGPVHAASILYSAQGGFLIPGEIDYPLPPNGLGDHPGFVTGGPRSRSGQLCPALTTPDYLCVSAYAGADLVGNGLLTLHAETRVIRRQGVGTGVDERAYGDVRIEIFGLTGVLLPTAGIARFNFGLTGSTTHTSTNANVTVEATGLAQLLVNNNIDVQCLGNTCPPIDVTFDPNDATSWNTQYLGVRLRADSRVVAPLGATFDADAIVDMRDTLQLLSIEVLDTNHQPVPGAGFVADLGNGNMITIPNTTPAVTTTTTTVPGATTTTTTTLPSGLVTRFLGGKTLALKHGANATKASGRVVLQGDLSGLDPTQDGAEVRLRGPDTGASDVWSLPASGWKRTKKGLKYTDTARANGPVTSAVIAKDKLTVTAKGTSIAYPLLGGGPQETIAVAVLFGSGSTALCADFPGAGRTPKKDDPGKGVFVATKAPAPTICRGL